MKYLLIIFLGSSLYAQYITAGKLGCENVLNFQDFKGQTFLSFMQETGKPILDSYANEGYEIRSVEDLKKTLKNVSSKVQRKVYRGVKKKESNFVSLAKDLEGKPTNLYDLPWLIADLRKGYSIFDLSTFFGLASCGGLILQFEEGNIAYNIHYGPGYNKYVHKTQEEYEKHRKDKRTGRSFGEGPTREADDASDKAYLQDLEEYVHNYDKDIEDFYGNLFLALTNSDTSNFLDIVPFGQTLLTDFLAVYTAEQARNLMDNHVSIHWDAALLEVTLLGAFHAGQDEIYLYFDNPNTDKMTFTNTVLHQAPGGSERTKERSARLYDYWQFSTNPDPEHRNRSGINITKRSFRTLGKKITTHMRSKYPELLRRIEKNLGYKGKATNIFYSLSKFLINDKTPKILGEKSLEITLDYTQFLLLVKEEASIITNKIKYYKL